MEAVISALIPAIVENVFGALTEAVGLSDWLRQRLGRDPEKLAFHQALTQALTDSATHYPGRDVRYFAEILRDIGGPLLAHTMQPAAPLPTADELTTVWLNHLTVDSLIHYRVEFTQFANHFLDRLQFHLENQQPLQWIAQARRQRSSEEAMRRMVEVAEQSATSVEALRQEVARLTATLASVLQTSSGSTVITGGGAYIGSTVSAQNFAGRDLTIKNYFVAGLPRLVIDYSSRIHDFLLEYLGSKRKRVPFGGRQQQLAELNAWLDDPAAPPYYLMSAEAGRGKSALVCRWLAQLTTRPDLDVIFVPISIRFETATQDVVFAALAARLANLYESEPEKLPPASLTAEQWKGVCQSYLRREPATGKQLVVILDGLDEAAGWTPSRGLFSADPPDGLRVLVTARSRPGESSTGGWTTTVGWEDEQLARAATLPVLERRGVEEALASMGNPLDRLATKVDVVGELHRLSEGDPLLVRLYVDALVAQGQRVKTLRAEDLRTIQPGLKGYIERWWQDQREQWRVQGRSPITEQAHLRLLLNAIAASLGPVTLDDLAALHPDLADSTLLHELLEHVSRWLVGDGKAQGYSYSHPRLGYYFWEQLGHNEQQAWGKRFIDWGKRILYELNGSMLAPTLAPRYLLQHYTTHLERANAPPALFYALISNGWRKAWEVLDVSYAGFLNDVNQAWERAKHAYIDNQSVRTEALVRQVSAALCRSSIAALGSNIKPKLLAQLVNTGLWTPVQALAIVKLVADEEQKSKMLIALAPHLPTELLAEALNTAYAFEDEYHRARALGALAPHLPAEFLEEVLTAARAIRDVSSCAAALRDLAPYLPAELLTEAWTAAHALEDEYYRDWALAALAPHLPENRQMTAIVKALSATRAIKYRSPYLNVLGVLAPHLPDSEQEKVLGEALTAARAIRDASTRTAALRDLAPHLSAEILIEALNTAHALEDEYHRARVLSALAPHLPAEFLEEALAAARAIRDVPSRAAALGALAPHLPERERRQVLGEILVVARAIRDVPSRAAALGVLAPYLPRDLLGEALRTAHAIGFERHRVAALRDLAPHLAVWASQQPQQSHQVFAETLPVLAARPRPEFVNDLAALMPFILALAGDEAPQAAEGIYQAIQCVGVVAIDNGFGTRGDWSRLRK